MILTGVTCLPLTGKGGGEPVRIMWTNRSGMWNRLHLTVCGHLVQCGPITLAGMLATEKAFAILWQTSAKRPPTKMRPSISL